MKKQEYRVDFNRYKEVLAVSTIKLQGIVEDIVEDIARESDDGVEIDVVTDPMIRDKLQLAVQEIIEEFVYDD